MVGDKEIMTIILVPLILAFVALHISVPCIKMVTKGILTDQRPLGLLYLMVGLSNSLGLPNTPI